MKKIALIATGLTLSFIWVGKSYLAEENSRDYSGAQAGRFPAGQNFNSKSHQVGTTQLAQSSSAVKEKLNFLKECLVTQKCNYPNSDSREYSLAVYKAMAEEISSLADAMTDEITATEIVLEYFFLEDGYVKDACLNLAQQLPQNEKLRDASLDAILSFHDGYLVEKGMKYWSKYSDQQSKNVINQKVQKVLQDGSPFVREYASKNVGLLLDESNVEDYESLAKTLAHDSVWRRNLEAAIANYKARRSNS